VTNVEAYNIKAEIFVNPVRKEIRDIYNSSNLRSARFIAVLEDKLVYVWDGQIIHAITYKKIKNKLKNKTIFEGDGSFNERGTNIKLNDVGMWYLLCNRLDLYKTNRDESISTNVPYVTWNNYIKVANGNWKWLDNYVAGANNFIKKYIKKEIDYLDDKINEVL